ncbi:RagB/SusD family nutrient uptake outer membrane protein [uncultured Bacteroides sp.]|nr:RagB/SusD family nutrient uptake outer membrane protein [uncultured Bacteroides sp.]
MKKIQLIIAVAALTASFASCDKFMDTVPKGKVIPTTTDDFKSMIIDVTASSVAYPTANVCSDDVFNNNLDGNTSNGRAYYWMEDFYKENEKDPAWNAPYEQMYKMNVVVENIMGATEGTLEEKEAILAEAKCWRAYYNWYLQSLYAPAYQASTAATDLSVPLVLIADLEAKHSRATVEEVTSAIWADLQNAETLLPENAANDYRPNKAAVYALKARIYFYMCEYDKAAEQAKLALAENSALNDMRTWSFKNEEKPFAGINNKPLNPRESPERIWYQSTGFSSMITSYCISDDLQAMYAASDLRFKFWFTNRTRGGDIWEDGRYRYLQELDYSFTVPEMMLIEAEALARKNDAKALDILNELRMTRFQTEDYVPLTEADGDDLLAIVLAERRRELALSGLRWLDMKRLAKDGRYTQTLIRTLNGVDYKLEPDSKLYLFPIPPQVLSLNSNIIPNDRKQ